MPSLTAPVAMETVDNLSERELDRLLQALIGF
jgi:hypothetical protein